jgi:hypothetical protein
MEAVEDLSLNVVGYDAQKTLLHLTNTVYMLMVEKVELDPPIMRTPNLQDSEKPYYQLQKL